MQSHRRNVALSRYVCLWTFLSFPGLFATLLFFFYPGRVHVAKSEMPPFQRTIPLYGSRNIWVAWLARLDFPSFSFFPSLPLPLFLAQLLWSIEKKKQHAYLRCQRGMRVSRFPISLDSLNTDNPDTRIALNWSLIYVERRNFFRVAQNFRESFLQFERLIFKICN